MFVITQVRDADGLIYDGSNGDGQKRLDMVKE
jgi:hypothetical protein